MSHELTLWSCVDSLTDQDGNQVDGALPPGEDLLVCGLVILAVEVPVMLVMTSCRPDLRPTMEHL